ncbi:MAG: hypothetical protein MUE60_15630 [Candidatus Eisenbacteria bacterium]|nr:hypothetical protein [Candidatus Eisenbacteria bacterium]
MVDVTKLLEKHGIAGRDGYGLRSSALQFPDGAHYRMEISGVHTVADMEALVDECRKRRTPVHRVIAAGDGTNLLTSGELRQLARLGHEAGIEVIVIPGPRANLDAGKHAHTDWGRFSGVRVRGTDSLGHFVADVFRSYEAGIRGFLFYGEDTLHLMQQMRSEGDFPTDTVFKVSYTQGVSNAVGARLLEQLGADSINPVSDLTLPMLASIRAAVRITMDIVTISDKDLGLLNRFWEGPELARVCSPCYFKQEFAATQGGTREKVKYCEIMQEIVESRNPSLRLSGQGAKDLRVPVIA